MVKKIDQEGLSRMLNESGQLASRCKSLEEENNILKYQVRELVKKVMDLRNIILEQQQ